MLEANIVIVVIAFVVTTLVYILIYLRFMRRKADLKELKSKPIDQEHGIVKDMIVNEELPKEDLEAFKKILMEIKIARDKDIIELKKKIASAEESLMNLIKELKQFEQLRRENN